METTAGAITGVAKGFLERAKADQDPDAKLEDLIVTDHDIYRLHSQIVLRLTPVDDQGQF